MKLSVFGGTGFVGGNYMRMFPYNNLMARDALCPDTPDVLYLISTTHNYHVFTDVHKDIDTNLSHLVDVLEAWRKNLDGRDGVFSMISSWFVYGNCKLPACECTPCDPKGFYSITKRAAEQLVISYCETFDLKYRILRLGNVVGRGDATASAKKNALQYLINEMKAGRPIELYEDGNFNRDMIHVDDCCEAINLVCETGGDYNTIYNIGNGYPVHFGNVIRMAHRRMGSTSTITPIPQKDFHKKVQTKTFYMSTTKLQKLGYSPKYSVSNIVDEMIS